MNGPEEYWFRIYQFFSLLQKKLSFLTKQVLFLLTYFYSLSAPSLISPKINEKAQKYQNKSWTNNKLQNIFGANELLILTPLKYIFQIDDNVYTAFTLTRNCINWRDFFSLFANGFAKFSFCIRCWRLNSIYLYTYKIFHIIHESKKQKGGRTVYFYKNNLFVTLIISKREKKGALDWIVKSVIWYEIFCAVCTGERRWARSFENKKERKKERKNS